MGFWPLRQVREAIVPGKAAIPLVGFGISDFRFPISDF